ncbi:MAG: hypothetical protein ACO1OB_19620 [Archangium sp.]
MLLPLLFVLSAAPVGSSSGVLTPPLIGSPSDAALRFGTSRAAELGVTNGSKLVHERTLSTRLGPVVYLQQTIDGLPVWGGRVIVSFDDQQRVVRTSSTAKHFTVAKTAALLSAPEALVIASKEVQGAWLQKNGQPYGGATKRAFFVDGELHAGWLTFVPTLKNSENWHVAVDATNGTVLWVRNLAWASNAAKVYASSPGGANGGVGVTPTIDVELTHTDGGFLRGDRIRAINCCPTSNCEPDAGPQRATGQTQTFGGEIIDFDVAICAQVQRATNDPSIHPSGDYVYAPIDPPNTLRPSINNPADYDEFAEVHAYFHVNKAFDAVRALSASPFAQSRGVTPFVWRDTGANGDLPAVWVNVSDSDFNSAEPNAQGVYVSDTLSRTETALYLARENMEFLLLPPQVLASDAFVIYQGQKADFAYDGPVLWHEFGHGVIHSTADWATIVTFDAYSANNESSALHEGMADVIAVMTGNDPVVGVYVAQRMEPVQPSIRTIDNQDKCPDVLWGESHQDSLHFTGAIWEARQQFLGTDNGATFDAAIYAAMVQFPMDVNFGSAAELITDSVVRAFPAVTDAQSTLEGIFTARGVQNCSKALDITNSLSTTRTYFGIPGSSFAGVNNGQSVPGPFQFKLQLPRGAKSVTMRAQGFGGGGGGGSRLELLGALDRRVTFTKNDTVLTNDAMWRVVPTSSQGVITGKLEVDAPCGSSVYVAIANTSQRDRQLYEVGFEFEEADGECPEVDAGVLDGGVDPVVLDAAKESLGDKAEGCSCSTVSPFGVFALVAFALRRRRSRR